MKLLKRKRFEFLLISSSLILILFYYNDLFLPVRKRIESYINGAFQNVPCYSENNLRIDRPFKYILQWTKPNTEPFVFWGRGQEEFIKRKCKVNNCYVTSNRSLLPDVSDYDAVAFHGPEIIKYVPGPHTRSSQQKYVYVSIESSHYYPICDKRYDGYFNWTWTYRLDSDEIYGYMTIRNAKGDIIGPNKIMNWIKLDSMQQINAETKERLEKKSKTAAWFVSNCISLSKREKFVHQLQRELRMYSLNIDIFGKCRRATNTCPKAQKQDCLKMIQNDYYFYLSLENSFSEDYVTEKLLTALQNYAVPVVFGAANYTRFMPDGIYLHGGNLTPEDLAKEMNDIINDKERYYSFFKWRNHYSYHNKSESPDSEDLCRMCEMLNDATLMTKKTTYTNFKKWWNVPGACL